MTRFHTPKMKWNCAPAINDLPKYEMEPVLELHPVMVGSPIKSISLTTVDINVLWDVIYRLVGSYMNDGITSFAKVRIVSRPGSSLGCETM